MSVARESSALEDAGLGLQRNRIARLASDLRVAAWPAEGFPGILEVSGDARSGPGQSKPLPTGTRVDQIVGCGRILDLVWMF